MYYTSPGRPPIFKNRKTIIAYVEESVYNEIKDIARRKGVSVSEVVRGILESYLKQKGKLKGEEKEDERVDPEFAKILRNNQILKMEAELLKLRKEFRKTLVVKALVYERLREIPLEELIKLAESSSEKEPIIELPSDTLGRIRTPLSEILSEKVEVISKILDRVNEIMRKAQRLKANELYKEAKELSKEISGILTRLLRATKNFP